MASDTYHDDGAYASKIFRLGDRLCGISGDSWYAALMINWISDGMRGPPPDDPEFRDADDDPAPKHYNVGVLILDKKGLYTMTGLGVEFRMSNTFFSMGSGSDYAIGSMERASKNGAVTPDELLLAVEAAAKYADGVKLPAELHYLNPKRKR